MPTESGAGRSLSSMERAIWMARHAGSYNCLAIAEIQGRLSPEQLRSALDAVQSRQTFLRVRIRQEKGRVFFQPGDTPSVPFRVVQAPAAGWVAEAERELLTPISLETGPLLRCVQIRHPGDASTLLLNCSHIMADGFACAHLLHDILRAAAGPQERACTPDPGPLHMPPSMFDRLPARARGLRGFLRMIRLLTWDFFYNLRSGGFPRRLRFGSWPPFSERRSRLIPVVCDEAFTQRLLARARREQTTVHGALCAAGLLAVSRVMTDGSPRALACTSSVDMRSRLEPPVGEELGLFVSVLWSVQKVWRDRPFWDLARAVRENLGRKLEADCHLAGLTSSNWFVPLMERILPRTPAGSSRYARMVESSMLNYRGTGVSNGGAMEISGDFGPFRIVSFRGAVSLLNTGYFTALVSTFNGRLYINYVYNEPLISTARAERLAATAQDALKAALL